MILRKYRSEIRKYLIRHVGTTKAYILMKTYKQDFRSFLDKGWGAETAAMAMLMGY